MTVTAPPPPSVEIDDGVIEEARLRQRRRRLRIAALLAGGAIIAGVLVLVFGGGGSPASGHPERSRLSGPRLTYVRGIPYVDGQVFPLVVRASFGPGAGLNDQDFQFGGGDSYPQRGASLFGNDSWSPGPVGPMGEIDYYLAEPDVAAVRVPGVGTVKPAVLPELPPRIRAVVFYRPPGSRGTIVPPGMTAAQLGLGRSQLPAITLTPLDAHGRPLATPPRTPPLRLPTSYWQGTTSTPAAGRCALRSTERGVRVSFGLVATKLIADPQAFGPAFFGCLDEWFILPRTGSLQVGILLNAQRPGFTPAPLWGATAVPGHPALVEVPPIQYREPAAPYVPRAVLLERLRKLLQQPSRRLGGERAHLERILKRIEAQPRVPSARSPVWRTLASRLIARREGDAWLVVDSGSLAQEIGFLNTLYITRLDVPGQ